MAPLSQKPRLNLHEKLRLGWLLLTAPFHIAFNLARIAFLAIKRGVFSKSFVMCAYIRFVLGKLEPRHIQYIAAPSREVYASWTSKKRKLASSPSSSSPSSSSKTSFGLGPADLPRLQHDEETLPDGKSSILWLGNRREATKFVLFFHGGGFMAPMIAGHLEWCWNAYVKAGESAGIEVAVAMLQYTLCPEAVYPEQLHQASAALSHMLGSGIRPGDIVVGGDSAGGNLVGGLMGHLLHPHGQCEGQMIRLDEPLGGAFLVSPWVGSGTTSASFQRNGQIDMLSAATIERAKGCFLPQDKHLDEMSGGNYWAFPADAEVDGGWFDGLDQVVGKVYVTAGAHEVFFDQTVRFAEIVRNAGGRKGNGNVDVRLEVADGEAHDFILFEGPEGFVGGATERMIQWVEMVWGVGGD